MREPLPPPVPSWLPSRRALKTLAWTLALALVAALVLQNRDPVQTRVLLVTLEMPLVLLLALTGALGFVLGLIAPALWRRRRAWPRPEAAARWREADGSAARGEG